jgi:hypothetical protein
VQKHKAGRMKKNQRARPKGNMGRKRKAKKK